MFLLGRSVEPISEIRELSRETTHSEGRELEAKSRLLEALAGISQRPHFRVTAIFAEKSVRW